MKRKVFDTTSYVLRITKLRDSGKLTMEQWREKMGMAYGHRIRQTRLFRDDGRTVSVAVK